MFENAYVNVEDEAVVDFDYDGPLEHTDVMTPALSNFETFHDLPEGTAAIEDIVETSAGVLGWAATDIQPQMLTELEHQDSF
jgi:hypothetical protein